MTAKLNIELSDEVLQLLVQQRSLTLTLTSGASGGSKPATGGDRKEPRPGSWMAKVIAWAEKRGKPFGTTDVMKRFKKLTRGHASMLLTKLASDAYPIERIGRGKYQFAK